ncbi:MAG TPA: hypothetical protein VHU40_14240 [Polyangia bacterium]|nr:hypothetical protein [Polyangia bacterium]
MTTLEKILMPAPRLGCIDKTGQELDVGEARDRFPPYCAGRFEDPAALPFQPVVVPHFPACFRRGFAVFATLLAMANCSDDSAPRPWNERSQYLRLQCSGFLAGSMRFEADRAQLSAEQLRLLSNLRIVDAVEPCVADGRSCSIDVTQIDGTRATWEVAQSDSACGNPRKVVASASFEPFRATLVCQFAPLGMNPTPRVVSADSRCFNGLLVNQGETIATSLDVVQGDVTSPRHLELANCNQPGRLNKVRFSVFDGGSLLASSSPTDGAGAEGTCATLDLTFPRPGRFDLKVQADADISPTGSMWLRFW